MYITSRNLQPNEKNILWRKCLVFNIIPSFAIKYMLKFSYYRIKKVQENEYITLVFYMFVIKRNLSYLLVTTLSKVQYFPRFCSTGLGYSKCKK